MLDSLDIAGKRRPSPSLTWIAKSAVHGFIDGKPPREGALPRLVVPLMPAATG
jgi:hypothetical protein